MLYPYRLYGLGAFFVFLKHIKKSFSCLNIEIFWNTKRSLNDICSQATTYGGGGQTPTATTDTASTSAVHV